MAVSQKAVSTPSKTTGSNALAALLAAAASSMQPRQPQQHPPSQSLPLQQQQQSPQQIYLSDEQQHQQSRSNQKRKSTTTSNLSFSSISKQSTDKDSTPAAELLIKLVSGSLSNGTTPVSKLTTSNQNNSMPILQTTPIKTNDEPEHVTLRSLETWHDEDEQPIDYYQELVDQSGSNGWSADEMFKYNEKMHNITSNYNERTLSKNYTTPLPKINSKVTIKVASQLAKEIEDKVIAQGRITPESSDDDELFEAQKMQKAHLRQQKQLDQLRTLQQQHRFTNRVNDVAPQLVNNKGANKTAKSLSQYSNSTETPATVSLSSSPTLNDIIIKPVTSSSRNILRTCLT